MALRQAFAGQFTIEDRQAWLVQDPDLGRYLQNRDADAGAAVALVHPKT